MILVWLYVVDVQNFKTIFFAIDLFQGCTFKWTCCGAYSYTYIQVPLELADWIIYLVGHTLLVLIGYLSLFI